MTSISLDIWQNLKFKIVSYIMYNEQIYTY